jgi:hypothetical protein
VDSLASDGVLAEEVRQKGVEPTKMARDSIQVHEGAAGLDPATVALIVAFLAPPMLDVWKHVFLPRIRRKWGDDVIGDPTTNNPDH